MKKRICSIVLAVLMLVCFTIPAFAADVSNTTIIDCGDGYYLKVTLTEYSDFRSISSPRWRLI